MKVYTLLRGRERHHLFQIKISIRSVLHILQSANQTAHFKAWIDGKTRGVAAKYLPHYLAWFRESESKLNSQQILQFVFGEQQ